MREGAYVKSSGRERVVGSPNHATLYDAGREFVVSHPVGDRTRGTTFLLDPEFFATLRRDVGGAKVDDPARPFGRLAAPVSPRTQLLYRVLVHYLERSPNRDELLVEDAVFALLRSVVRDLPGDRPPRRPASRRIRDRVTEIQTFVADHLDRSVTLAELGERLGCSPEYVSRIFSQEVGVPLSRWVARLRLSRATDRIMNGADGLAEVALDVGFASHSHFTATFAREFETTPSRVRAGLELDRVHGLMRELGES